MTITWNPDDKNANITLSNGNLTATSTNIAHKAARATESKNSGKWYWEITVDAAVDTKINFIGVGNGSATLASYVGSDANGWSYQGNIVAPGYKYHSAASVAYGNDYVDGDIVGVALDLNAGKIWWSKNGVWQASGDPVAGTGEAYSGLTGDIYPMVSLYQNSNAITANFGASTFTYTPPTGFSGLDTPFDNTDWSNKLELTLDHTKVDSDLIDFPVLIVLSSGTGITEADVTNIFDEIQYTVKSVIIDIADNWGGAVAMMCRALEFKNNGTLLQVGNGVSFTAYGSSHSAPYIPDNLFDVTKSKTGVHAGNGWQTNAGNTNIRVICVFDTPQNFNEIVINNHHDSGASTEYGIKNIKISISSDAITSIIYDEEISNSEKIFDGQIAQHVASDVVDDQYVSLTLNKKIAITTTISGVETECYTEIESWDWENAQAWLWTKIPTVYSGSDTTLYLYYDSTQPDNSNYIGDTGDAVAQNVWDDYFVGVWHMSQDPNGDVADVVLDSTSNINHGTPAGLMTSADLVDGKIGKGIDLDGSDDYVNVGTDSSLEVGGSNFTVEAIGAWTTGVNAAGIVALGNLTTGYGLTLGYSDVSKVGFVYNTSTWAYNAGTGLNDDEYHYVVGKLVDSTPYIFVDSTSVSYSVGGVTCGSYNAIGEGYNGGRFNGIVDEVRISSTDRSNAWIKATYYSNWNNLISYELIIPSIIYFYFSNPIPENLSTHYGTTTQLYLTTTLSGIGIYSGIDSYDATFYTGDNVQIDSTVSGIDNGSSANTSYFTISGGISYDWYVVATASGFSDTSSTYSFTNKFLCAGTTEVNDTLTSGIPVRLYRRSTGELIGSTVSTTSGTFEVETDYNESHYCVALYASTASGVDITETNALIYDHLEP